MTGFINPIKPRGGASYAEALSRIRRWVKEAIPPGEPTISVTELACAEPGCPPRETIILVMWADEPAWKLRIHKSMPDVTADDVALSLRSPERVQQQGS